MGHFAAKDSKRNSPMNEKYKSERWRRPMVSNEIEYKRKDLIQVAKKHGINADITLKCSQELDMLLLKQIRESIKKTDLLKKRKHN